MLTIKESTNKRTNQLTTRFHLKLSPFRIKLAFRSEKSSRFKLSSNPGWTFTGDASEELFNILEETSIFNLLISDLLLSNLPLSNTNCLLMLIPPRFLKNFFLFGVLIFAKIMASLVFSTALLSVLALLSYPLLQLFLVELHISLFSTSSSSSASSEFGFPSEFCRVRCSALRSDSVEFFSGLIGFSSLLFLFSFSFFCSWFKVWHATSMLTLLMFDFILLGDPDSWDSCSKSSSHSRLSSVASPSWKLKKKLWTLVFCKTDFWKSISLFLC